jgi:hypothetical protein
MKRMDGNAEQGIDYRKIENRMKICPAKEIVKCSINLVKDDIEKRDSAVTFNC